MKTRAYCHIPPRTGAVLAAALTLAMAPAQTPPVPPAEEDIRPPRNAIVIPEPESSPPLRYLILAAVLAGAGVGLWWWMRRFRPAAKTVTPLDQARETLNIINSRRETLTSGELAEQTANVVRHFIAGQFRIAAPRRTTEEFLRSLTTGAPSPLTPHLELLEGFLTTCDQAKFAGSDFDPVERYALIETAGRFVQAAAYTAPAPSPGSPSPHPLPDA